ncbi:MAG: hypothetical protein HN731_19860 [Rhodospirillaceae bacterium]|nr:hypothetical protein [Rhodospirillaceae bacterium]MBT7957465.1 hypothetical protein [Rhodospirillaceae bacterium]
MLAVKRFFMATLQQNSISLNKHLFLIVAAMFLAVQPSLMTSAQAQSTQRIVAIVNNEIITHFDLAARIKFIIFSSRLPKTNQTVQRISRQVLNGLINDYLKLQAAKKMGVKTTQNEINRAIKIVEKNNRLQPGGMQKLLARENVDWRTFELQIEAELSWRGAVVRQVRSSTKVGDDAVDEAIATIEANKGKPEYFVAEIFVPFDPTKSIEETRQNALGLRTQIQSGANFSALARSFSKSASAAKGGNLGWIRSDQVDQNLSKIIVSMSKGDTTNPVRGADGYYILRLLNKRIASGVAAANVKVSLQQVFLPLREKASQEEITTQQKLAAKISKSSNSCSALEKMGTELGSKQSGRLEVQDTSRLPANIKNVVQNIALSKASSPIRTAAGFLVLMVCKRSGGNITEKVRSRIRNVLTEKRAALISRRMLRDIRRSAVLDIRG